MGLVPRTSSITPGTVAQGTNPHSFSVLVSTNRRILNSISKGGDPSMLVDYSLGLVSPQ